MEINNSQNPDQLAYEMAQKKVKKLKNFYVHLIVYLLVNSYLVIMKYINLHTGDDFFTFKTFSTAFFWGIGLVAHAFSVFVPYFVLGKEWEEKKVRQYMNKEKDNKWE